MNLRNKFRQPRFEKALADLVAKHVLGQQRGVVPQDRHLLFRCHLVGKRQAKLSGREDIIGQGWVVQRLSGGRRARTGDHRPMLSKRHQSGDLNTGIHRHRHGR